MSYTKTRIAIMGRERSIKERKLLALRGVPSATPAGPIRAHITRLHEMGMTDAMIARAAGITESTVDRLMKSNPESVRIRHAAAIMKVDHHPHPHQVYVLAIGARRRLQALRASGYSIPEIAEHTESSGDSLYSSTRRPTITLRRWLEVREVYALLSATPGKNTKAARMAAEKGWPLPMEWEGYDIDDPRVTPKETRRKGGDTARARRVELVERVQELTERGETAKRIAERLGVHERTVVRYRSEVAA